MNAIHLVFAAALVLGFTPPDSDVVDELRCDLIEDGFENVSLVLKDRRLTVTYENRVYRHGIRAIRAVMATLSPLVKEGMSVTLIPQNRGVPLFAITIPADEELVSETDVSHDLDSVWEVAQALLSGESSDERRASGIDVIFDVDSAWREIQDSQETGYWSHRFGLVLHPQFRAEYGDDTDLVLSQFNLVPEINASLWKGMLLSAQLVIPIQNELDEGGDYWRPGLLTLNQALRLPYNTFVSTTLGHFTQRRYGADMEVRKYFANGRWSAGANIGYTGYGAYIDGVWFYSRMGLLTALFDVEYRLSRFDLGCRATLGRFLYRDRGLRLDIYRQYDEVDFGFFAHKTEGGENAGFNIRIPISPSKHLSIGGLRIGPAKEFRQEYRYRGFLNEGVYYDTGNSVDRFLERLHPDYIRNQLKGGFEQ